MERVPTVKIECDGEHGHRIINESDFKPEVHKLFKEKPAKKIKEKDEEETTFGEKVGPFTVGKEKKKFVILNMAGERIAADEYDSEALAWAAAAPLMATGG